MRFDKFKHFAQRLEFCPRPPHHSAAADQDRFRGDDLTAIDRPQMVLAQGRAGFRKVCDQIGIAHTRRRFHRAFSVHQYKV